ncbi:hypothetical protein [Cohnella sp. REN36]|uniref:hypothetical protein n=1 Tax=Cohnella sp. REN36 TaxID=2887347 RepID=UPI001D132BFF|nr:hypothetical protein [Cohnella sp. REN36]MCC3374918.1 hypothetical protein [Cohnella sp. REN36]
MNRNKSKRIASLLIAAVLVLLTAACASGGAKRNDAASPKPTAAERTYRFDLKSTRAEPMPDGAGGAGPNNALGVSPTDLEAVATLTFDLARKGDFLLAEGEGVLWTGTRSLPFKLDQTSVVREDTLDGETAFVHGTLQATTTGKQLTSFALDFRLLPDAYQLELRLPAGKQFVVFGDSPAMAERAEEIGKLVFR